MLPMFQRKTVLILALAASLAVTLVVLAADEQLREQLGTRYWLLGLAIIGSVLLLLAGYVWDRSTAERLREIKRTAQVMPTEAAGEPETHIDAETDEIMGLARQIERMARSLQKVEASYRAVVEDQVDLICRYRADGTLTFVNSAYVDFFGGKRPDHLGQRLPLLMLGYPRRDYQGEFAASQEFEVELKGEAGRAANYAWTHRAITGREGEVLEYQAVGRDITARKQAEAALHTAKEAAESADRAKSEFLAVVSHELRTPIHGIIGFAKLLRDGAANDEHRDQATHIYDAGLTLEALINDILDLSRIEAGAIEIGSAPFALRDSLHEIEDYFRPRATKQGLQLETRIDPGVPVILNGDQARLRQILHHLVGNAVKFTEKGRISVSVSAQRGEDLPHDLRAVRLFFAVSDTGIGIPADKLGLLFRSFSQVDASSTRRRSGAGLGLAISRRLCELMGGAVSVDSTPGKGSTFRFSVAMNYQKGDSRAPLPTVPARRTFDGRNPAVA
jgi:PAS domain S-box-containing protein